MLIPTDGRLSTQNGPLRESEAIIQRSNAPAAEIGPVQYGAGHQSVIPEFPARQDSPVALATLANRDSTFLTE